VVVGQVLASRARTSVLERRLLRRYRPHKCSLESRTIAETKVLVRDLDDSWRAHQPSKPVRRLIPVGGFDSVRLRF
jgi:hypothetical protein